MFLSLNILKEILTHQSRVCGVLIGALINNKCSDCMTASMILHCFSESGVRVGGMKGQFILGSKLRWVIGMKKRERGIARMCGETYGVCERLEEAKVSERERKWASSYTISSGFNGFMVKDTNSVYREMSGHLWISDNYLTYIRLLILWCLLLGLFNLIFHILWSFRVFCVWHYLS